MARGRLDGQYIYPVLVKRTRELVIALETESTT